MDPIDLSFLSQTSLFLNIPIEVISEIASGGTIRAIEEGEFYFQQGDPAEYIYILLKGRLKLYQISKEGQQVGMRLVVAGETFGALGVTHPNPNIEYPVCAEVIEDCVALAWKSNQFKKLMLPHPQISMNVSTIMTMFLREMQDRYRELASERVERRVARALLRLIAQSGEKTGRTILIELSRQDLAEMTGTTLFTVSRVLSEWERAGILESGREKVIVKNPHKLVEIAEDIEKG